MLISLLKMTLVITIILSFISDHYYQRVYDESKLKPSYSGNDLKTYEILVLVNAFIAIGFILMVMCLY